MRDVDPERSDLVAEFFADPLGEHSPDLIQMLNRLRVDPPGEKLILVTEERHRRWRLGIMSGVRGEPARLLGGYVFQSLADAEREVFKIRWRRHTGRDVPGK